jgi:hypothetical protein
MGHNDSRERYLTFMSIRAHIAALEANGKLVRYLPRSSRLPAKRRLYLTESAVKDLTDHNSATNVLGLRGLIEADLTTWTLGGLVHTDERGRPCFLKPLCPPPPPREIWELRVTEPRVHVRLFCRFAEPDTLVMHRFHTRGMLGKRASPEWLKAREKCAATWDELFPSFIPFSAERMREYVTENCDDFAVCPS